MYLIKIKRSIKKKAMKSKVKIQNKANAKYLVKS